MASMLVTDGSKTTVAVLAAKSISTDRTPLTCSIAFFTVTGQSAQVMFSTAKVADWMAATWLTERWADRSPTRARVVEQVGWLPVPFLGAVVFLIAASQVQAVFAALPVLGHVLGVFIAFLVIAALVGVLLMRALHLPVGSGRALIFSLGTRNSFVVLPLSLALGHQWQTATVVIVFQSLVELFGMVAYLWLVPRILASSSVQSAS